MSLHSQVGPHRVSEPPLAQGDIVDGKFEIEQTLGVGGMGIVFAARHLQLDERVAIKVLLPEFASNADVVARFEREGRAASKIKSEHVVRVTDVGALDSGLPFLVMEYLEGRDLERVLSEDGPFAPSRAVDLILQACEALAEAHRDGTVHRDLKPANLFVTTRPDGTPSLKILDFGISKVRSAVPNDPLRAGIMTTQAIMGSPQYMSPEQLTSTRDVDGRADIWSIGAIVYEMLCGEPPFRAASIPEICAMILKDPAPVASQKCATIPAGIDTAILRCLNRFPEQRFVDVGELAYALAPYGSSAAKTSAERIRRILHGSNPDRAPSDMGGILTRNEPHHTMTSWDDAPRVSPRRRASIFGWVAAMVIVLGVGVAGGMRLTAMRSAVPTQTSDSHVVATNEVPHALVLPIASSGSTTLTPTTVTSVDGGSIAEVSRHHEPSHVAPPAHVRGEPAHPSYDPPQITAHSNAAASPSENGDALFEDRK